jgi:hypothetical protein
MAGYIIVIVTVHSTNPDTYHRDGEIFMPFRIDRLLLDLRFEYSLSIQGKNDKGIRFASPIDSTKVMTSLQSDTERTLIY